MDDLKSRLIEQEGMLVSPKTRHNVEVIKQLIDKEFIEVAASGRRFGYDEVIERLPIESPMRCLQSDFECRLLTPTIAQLCYHAVIYTEKGELSSRRTSIWRLEQASTQWKMLYHQGTNLS
ncbi:MAG: hypothetical protein BM565_09825 [Gammaproteobacteria bacterium MedPE]|nr:MAG: hypothetical protein BM565_09825 [Gammaproteobacteria bacterium MedPE]